MHSIFKQGISLQRVNLCMKDTATYVDVCILKNNIKAGIS